MTGVDTEEKKSRKGRLKSARAALAYQKDWFGKLQARVASGERFAVVNADTPHEILRAFDIPYVVNQWWGSIAASLDGAQRYLALVDAHGYPRDSEQYNAIALGSAWDTEPETAPWGGLPKPFLVMSEMTGDAAGKVFDVWGHEDGVTFFAFENAASNDADPHWWDDLSTNWEHHMGSDRIDLLHSEMQELILWLEEQTGQTFDWQKFNRIMELGNEQAEWNRKTRDLIAQSRPCPISVNDSIPAVMVPQWHRGTEWARDAAMALYEDVRSRVDAGTSLASTEQARLMWIGRGLWFDLGFYRHFEEEFGAVFVWSMYLAIAADGYARYGTDTMRALASRFVGFNEHLYIAPMSAEWYVNEARRHGIDGVVHLVSDDPRGNWATTRAMEAAGIPVIEVHADNADASNYDIDEFRGRVAEWLRAKVLAKGA